MAARCTLGNSRLTIPGRKPFAAAAIHRTTAHAQETNRGESRHLPAAKSGSCCVRSEIGVRPRAGQKGKGCKVSQPAALACKAPGIPRPTRAGSATAKLIDSPRQFRMPALKSAAGKSVVRSSARVALPPGKARGEVLAPAAACSRTGRRRQIRARTPAGPVPWPASNRKDLLPRLHSGRKMAESQTAPACRARPIGMVNHRSVNLQAHFFWELRSWFPSFGAKYFIADGERRDVDGTDRRLCEIGRGRKKG